VVRELLARGATVDATLRVSGIAPYYSGSTSLLIASDRGHADVARLLLARGAAVNHASATGATALSRAVSEGRAEVAALLRAAGAVG
jgi:ankyrin repeat protein